MASDQRGALRRIGTCSLCKGPVMRHEEGGAGGRRILESVERGSGKDRRVSGRTRVVIECAWCGAVPADGEGAGGADVIDVIEMRPRGTGDVRIGHAPYGGRDGRRIESGAGGAEAHLGTRLDVVG